MMTKIRPLFLCLALMVSAFTIHAADYYVATSGSDTANNGSKSKPWRTITYGMQKMSGGDTLYLRGGTYTDGPVLNSAIRSGPGVGKYTRILGYPGEKAIWRPSNFSGYVLTLGDSKVSRSNIWFGEFTLDLAKRTRKDSGFAFNNFHNVVVSNLYCMNNPVGYGWIITAPSSTMPGGKNLTIQSCTFTNWSYADTSATAPAGHALYLKRTQGLVVKGNVFRHPYGPGVVTGNYAIHIYDHQTSVKCANAVIESNFIDVYYGGIVAGAMQGGTIRNNTIRNRGLNKSCIVVGYGAQKVLIENNKLYGGDVGIRLVPYTPQRECTFKGNSLYSVPGKYAAFIDARVTSPSYWNKNVLCKPIGGEGCSTAVMTDNKVGLIYDQQFSDVPGDLDLREGFSAEEGKWNWLELDSLDVASGDASRPLVELLPCPL